MPSHLPPVTQSLTTGLQQARVEQIASLSKLLDLTLGTTVSAIVEKVAPVTQQQRQVLLNQTNDLLAQLNTTSNAPGAKLQIGALLEQQTLLNSALLKLAQIQINGRALLTYTDTPVGAGDTIPLKLDALQRLIQIAPALNIQEPDQPKHVLEQATAKLQTQTMLAALLRNLLPQKDQPRELFSALPQLQQLPVNTRNQLLSQNVQQALKTLADQLRTPQQLSNPKLLPMILKNSGVQFEHKLAASLTDPAMPQATIKMESKRPSTGNPINPPALNIAFANRLTTQDVKGALLQLLDRVNQELNNSRPTAPTAIQSPDVTATELRNPLLASSHLLAASLPVENLAQFLHHLPTRSQAELSDKVLRTQLLLLLNQHTLSSLAKVQFQQVHTVNHQQSQIDSAQPTQSWLFEIPVRQGQDVQQLEVRIDQEWVDDEKNYDEKNTQKIKQWSVMLTFNLPDVGGFYAQLTILKDSVSAKLWAEHEATLLQAQQRLDGLREQLQAQGVEVKQLQCVHGVPPNRSISLNYALVDITT